jgi:hypothetical protein
MSDFKLFRVDYGKAHELPGSALAIEKTLQSLMEKNLEPMLGIRFITSEHSTGKAHSGRIDTLGLDENGSPVILEYKRSSNENVINQGLFYLDWLLDHRAEFTLLAMKVLGADVEEKVDWSAPRLVCIAGDFTRYDEHAVSQIGRNIELYRYRWYDDGFIALELVNSKAGMVEGRADYRRGEGQGGLQDRERLPRPGGVGAALALRHARRVRPRARRRRLDEDDALLPRLPPDQELRLCRGSPADGAAARLPEGQSRRRRPRGGLRARRQ